MEFNKNYEEDKKKISNEPSWFGNSGTINGEPIKFSMGMTIEVFKSFQEKPGTTIQVYKNGKLEYVPAKNIKLD